MVFAKTVNGFFLLFLQKNSILDVWRDSEFSSEAINDLQKKLHLRCWRGFEFAFLAN